MTQKNNQNTKVKDGNKLVITEQVVSFRDEDYLFWLEFNPQLMPKKLIDSFKKDIREGRKTKPEYHHFAANLVRTILEKKNYTLLLSEMSGNEYKLFSQDTRINKYVKTSQYVSFIETYRILRKSGIIKQGGGEPDLFVCKNDEAFFVEAKRIGPGNYKDELRENQKILISLIKYFLGLETKIFAVVHEDLLKRYVPKTYSWDISIEITQGKRGRF